MSITDKQTDDRQMDGQQFAKNAEWFTLLVPAYTGCAGKRPSNGCSTS